MVIPPEKRALLDDVVTALREVKGMEAIALGGSYARGTHRPDSDLDVGLYYRETAPFTVEDVRRIAVQLSASGAPTVTGFYDWGPFVNGGAWIDNAVTKIDFLYRNLNQLEREIADAKAGNWTHSFDQQPPFGFRSVTLLGEIYCSKPLHDPSGLLASLKESLAVYPPRLKARIVQDSLWLAEFSFQHAFTYFASDGDVPNTVATMTRIYHYLVQALYAMNETYFVNDKRSQAEIERFAHKPSQFGARVAAVLASPGGDTAALNGSLLALKSVFDDVVTLTRGAYKAKY